LADTGGDVGFVATEDVAVRAFKVYPERFGLIKHPQYPDVDSVRVTLTDLRKPKYGSLVEGNKRKGWRVTDNGSAWLASNKKRIELAFKSKLTGERRVSSGHLLTSDRIRSARLGRIMESDAYAKWEKGTSPTIYDFFEILRVDNYTPENVYREHLNALIESVQDNPDAKKFLTAINRMYGESYRQNG
jgi:hypothetical protein